VLREDTLSDATAAATQSSAFGHHSCWSEQIPPVCCSGSLLEAELYKTPKPRQVSLYY